MSTEEIPAPKQAFEFEYDAEADALYFNMATDFVGRLHTYLDPAQQIGVDVVDGVLVGLEVLNASRHALFCRWIPDVSGSGARIISARMNFANLPSRRISSDQGEQD